MNSFIDISIPFKFNGQQPNAYGADRAVSNPVVAGDLVGDTQRGGSCNFEQYTFIPHCNGTHTECVGHITHKRISVRDCMQDVIVPALLVSLEPENVGGEQLITTELLGKVLSLNTVQNSPVGPPCYADAYDKALIVRTLPNDESKLSREYDNDKIPPYFTTEAMKFIVEYGFKHLLVDMPSIDRLFDEGKLSNHRIFWNVEPGSFEVNENTRLNSTITELIYVPHIVEDGEYLLNLQIAPFESDASPSRPILFPIVADRT